LCSVSDSHNTQVWFLTHLSCHPTTSNSLRIRDFTSINYLWATTTLWSTKYNSKQNSLILKSLLCQWMGGCSLEDRIQCDYMSRGG
jgi:hypothetical protein